MKFDFERNLALRAFFYSPLVSAEQSALPKTNRKVNQMKAYKLAPTSSSKIAAALAKRCSHGEAGEFLVENGLNQANFCLFLSLEAVRQLMEKNKSDRELADVFQLLSAGNASAARQALADCQIEFEGEKPSSVSAYWLKQGGGKTAINLSALD